MGVTMSDDAFLEELMEIGRSFSHFLTDKEILVKIIKVFEASGTITDTNDFINKFCSV